MDSYLHRRHDTFAILSDDRPGYLNAPKAYYVKDRELSLSVDLEESGETWLVGTEVVPPSVHGSVFRFKARIEHKDAKKTASEAYLATTRRRNAHKLRMRIAELNKYETLADFAVYTFSILKDLKETIRQASRAETEGNAVEVLRLIRDTLLDTGWENYKHEAFRKVVCGLLEKLSVAERVKPDIAVSATKTLLPYINLPTDLFGNTDESTSECSPNKI